MSQQFPAQPTNGQPMYREDPGKTLSIIGLVFIVVFPLVGAILGYLGRKKSREAGFDGQLGNIAFIINTVLVVLGAIWVVFFLIAAMSAGSGANAGMALPFLGL